MPLYEYKCHSCGKIFEVLQKFADEPLKTHPDCGGEVERLFSAPAFHLKGTGWYATDYAKNSGSGSKTEDHKGESGKSESGKGESGKGESGKGESGKGEPNKGETKSDSKSESSSSSDASGSSPGSQNKLAGGESKPAASTPSTVSSDK